MLKFGNSALKVVAEPEVRKASGLRMAVAARDLDDDEPLVVSGSSNEYVDMCREMPFNRLIEIWKIGFCRLKRGALQGEDIRRYEAVKFVLSSFYRCNLPKDGR